LCKDANDKDVYEIISTEYSSPQLVTNLMANPINFVNTQSWAGKIGTIGFFPALTDSTDVANYQGEAYLTLNNGDSYNGGILANIAYFTPTEAEISKGNTGGIHKGEKYIFRIRCTKEAPYASNKLQAVGGGKYKSLIIGNIYPYDKNNLTI